MTKTHVSGTDCKDIRLSRCHEDWWYVARISENAETDPSRSNNTHTSRGTCKDVFTEIHENFIFSENPFNNSLFLNKHKPYGSTVSGSIYTYRASRYSMIIFVRNRQYLKAFNFILHQFTFREKLICWLLSQVISSTKMLNHQITAS